MEKKEDQKYWDPTYQCKSKGFEELPTLNEAQTRIALRVLKYHLEERLGWGMTDGFFIRMFKAIPGLHGIGLGEFNDIGYWQPLINIIKEFEVPCEVCQGVRDFQSFFRVFDFKPYSDNRHYGNLMLHIPHSSTIVTDDIDNPQTFDDEEWKLIDLYTDELYKPDEDNERIDTIIFPFCRLHCDVERLINDPLEKRGLGISYKRYTSDCTRKWGWSGDAYKRYIRYHQKVVEKIIEKSPGLFDSLLLIDCHSFSSLPNLLNANPPQNIDICIGFNEDETKPNKVVIGNIRNYFISKGYRVGINNPFSNSKTFDVPGGNEYHSVMIEVNKQLYMNEETLEKTNGFLRLHNDIQGLYDMLLRK